MHCIVFTAACYNQYSVYPDTKVHSNCDRHAQQSPSICDGHRPLLVTFLRSHPSTLPHTYGTEPMPANPMTTRTASTIFCTFVIVSFSALLAAAQEFREWSDSTGRFKINAKLIEIRDSLVFLEDSSGKSYKIPVSRLSQNDQDFVKAGDNPFEMVGEEDVPSKPDNSSNASGADSRTSSTSGSGAWQGSWSVDWNRAQSLTTICESPWNVPLPESGLLDFEPQQAALPKKAHFHEHMHPIAVNHVCRRAVVGSTVSFSVPKPLTRISLVDLETGKAVHSEQVEANMRPLALLDNGTSILMVGNGDERDGWETKDQLQVWRLQGKKIIRTPSWIPFEGETGRFNRDDVRFIMEAQPIHDNLVVTLTGKGHIVLWDIVKREPIWHARFSDRNFAMAVSVDRKHLALVDEKTVMVVNAETAEILGATSVTTNTGWCRIAWSPSGKKLLFTSINNVRVLDVATGDWEHDFALPGGPIATKGLSYPDDDYALFNNATLLHLPSRIQVCNYRGANSIDTIGGTSFIALFTDAGGLLAPGKFPHPTAESMLKKAQDDPTMFLIHPGVAVAVDVSAVPGQYQTEARDGLKKSIERSGYVMSASAPIKIVAGVSGPKQRAVSYIASGSYIANEFTTTLEMQWEGKSLWKTSGSNVPGFVQTSGDETIQDVLDRAGKSPNISMFGSQTFPEFMQRPSDVKGGASAGLLNSSFTLRGLVDGN